MLDFLRGDGDGPNLLAATLKAALALAALGYLAAHSLSSKSLDYKGLSRLAADVARKFPDPAVTGSVPQKGTGLGHASRRGNSDRSSGISAPRQPGGRSQAQ